MQVNRNLLSAIFVGGAWIALMIYWKISHPQTNPLIFFGVLILLASYMLASFYEFIFRITYSDSKTLTVLGWLAMFGLMIVFAILLTPLYCAICLLNWNKERPTNNLGK